MAQLADAQAEPPKPSSAPAPEHDALRALTADLPRLRGDPGHSNRKRLLRSLIADITLLPATDDSVRVGIAGTPAPPAS